MSFSRRHGPLDDIDVALRLIYALLDDEKWRTLEDYYDFSLFITAPAATLRQRLIQRKVAGGLSQDEAQAFYLRTDGPNVEHVLRHSRPADLTLHMTAEGEYTFARME